MAQGKGKATLQPRAQWQYAAPAGDWQPFALCASQALEEAFRGWSADGGSSVAALDGAAWAGRVDFAAMRFQREADGAERGALREGAVRREEHFEPSDVEALRAEVERLLEEREALAAEVEAFRAPAASARSLASAGAGFVGNAWPPHPRAYAASSAASQPAPRAIMTPGGYTATSVVSYRSATSQASGLMAVSAGSLESIAGWVFALNAHGVQPASAYERVLVPPGDPRRQWLEDYFLSSLQPHRRAYNSEEWCPAAEIQVMKIWEVINESANRAYTRELAQMLTVRPGDRTRVAELAGAIPVRTDMGGPQLNEALLFHGCKWESVFAILREGFDSRLGGTNAGAAFGIGSYFSTVASKADQYTQRWSDWERRPPCQVPPELRCMIVARVALGEVYESSIADQSLRRPPLAPDGVRCDSVMGVPRTRGGCVDYDEFIIYKPGQATPQFVMEYEHKPECRCRCCTSPWP